MKKLLWATLSLALVGATTSPAATVYDNTDEDTFLTYFYSSLGATQLGDSITLAGTDRLLSSATVQFFNNGLAGTFDATLRFWDLGSPNTQIGPSFVQSASIGEFGILDVTFSGLDLLVPDSLIFTVAVSNLSNAPNMDLGLNAFRGMMIGSSNNSAIIFGTGGPSLQVGSTGTDEGNLYFRLETAAVPEPTSMMLAGAALVGLLAARRRA